ncbi:hypothetical protein Tco_1394225 [Tanacetum coccineum]
MEAPQKTVDRHHPSNSSKISNRLMIMHPICFRFEYIMVENFKGIQAECESEPLFYNYLRPLTSLDEGLYALSCEEDVHCLATLVRSFKLIEVYIEHGVTALDCYIRPPRFRATIEDISDEPGSIAANITEKMLLFASHEYMNQLRNLFVTLSHLAFCHNMIQVHLVIDDVMRQLSFEEIELDEEAGFADVVRSGVKSYGLSHDESFRVDDLELNLNKLVNLNVSQIETQSKLHVSEEPDVPIVEEVGTQEFTMEDVILEDYVSSREDAEQCNGQEDESAPSDGQFFYDDEGIDTAYETEYDVQSRDAGINDDDDDEYFLLDEENEIVEPDVDVYLFGVSMDLPFDNIGVTNLVSGDVLEGEDVDVINVDGFDSDHGNDDKTNDYRRSRIRARCDEKVLVFSMSQGTGPTGPNRGIEAGPSGSSGPTTRSKKEEYMDNPDIPVKAVQDQLQRDLEVQISMSKAFRAKAKAEREIRGDHIAVERNTDPYLPTRVFQRIYVCLGALKLDFRARIRDILGLDGAFMKGPFPGQVLVAVGLDSNNGIYPLAYALVEAESKSSWCWSL